MSTNQAAMNDTPDPSRRRFLVMAPLGALGVTLVGCSSEHGSAPTESTSTTAGNPASPPEWPMYGHDFAQTRTNLAETSVTTTTVAKLTKGWAISDVVGVTGTPLVVDGIAYFSDWTGAVWAVESATGNKVWTTQVGGMIVGACALDDESVFVGVGSSLICLDRNSGKQRWTAKTDEHPQAQISASPVVVDGMVLQGTASFENTMSKEKYEFRGSIAAFDAATGANVWQFFTTPDDGTQGAGAGIWSTPAIDKKRSLLYVGTGQGLSEPTPELADSMLAIDYQSGKLQWSKQFTYPDVFSNGHPNGKDADVGASPNLWTINGRHLVGAGDKGGTYHALDRDTGEVVWETELTPGSVFGGQIGSAAYVDDVIVATSNVGDPDTNAPTDRTHAFGLDPGTGDKIWTSEELEGKIFAPISAVPGVAFVGTDRGLLLALDTKTGKKLWSTEAPAMTACGPSIVDGQLLWGYGFVLFGGPGPGGLMSFKVEGN